MKTLKRKLALLAAVSVALSSPFQYAYGAPAAAKSDETLYVNLDPYGKIGNVSVVKGYYLNEADSVTDYGNYEEVINMSNYAKPQIEGEKVSFNFDGKENRFYFEGKLKENTVELPWNIDVSYKLNGVEKNADQLAGEKGLVEINIDILPNEKTSEYFKNNMILQIGTMVNMDDNLSVEAEGAQVQTIGNIKAVVFMVMPKEEQHYTIRIGSDDFSFDGLFMMMMPGTLSQIEDIRKLREDKEKIEDSADALSDGLDVILSTMENLQSGLRETADGLKDLETARGTISSSKDEIYDEADIALNALAGISEASEPFVEHLENTKKLLNETNDSLNKITNTAKDFKPIISDAQEAVEGLCSDIEGLKTMVEEMNGNSESRAALTEQTRNDLDALRDVLMDLSYSLGGNSIGSMPSIGGLTQMPDTGGADPKLDMIIAMVNAKISEINGVLNSLGSAGGSISAETGDTLTYLGDLASECEALVGDIDEALMLFDDYMNSAETHSNDITLLADDMNKLLESLNNSLSLAKGLIDDSAALMDTLNKYEQDAEQSAADAKELVNRAIEGIDTTHKLLSTTKAVAQESGESLDSGTKALLSGTINAISTSLEGLAQTGTIRNAKDTIKDTIDNEWDEYSEDKMGFLNMDETLEPISFTSELNPSPESVQIVLRTEEITVDDDDGVDVDETFKADGNFITRIGNIFKQIWLKIKAVFS